MSLSCLIYFCWKHDDKVATYQENILAILHLSFPQKYGNVFLANTSLFVSLRLQKRSLKMWGFTSFCLQAERSFVCLHLFLFCFYFLFVLGICLLLFEISLLFWKFTFSFWVFLFMEVLSSSFFEIFSFGTYFDLFSFLILFSLFFFPLFLYFVRYIFKCVMYAQSAIMYIIFWDFLMIEQIFFSPQKKRSVITSNRLIYKKWLRVPEQLTTKDLRKLVNIKKTS